MLNRRNFVLTGAAGALSLGFAPRLAFARAATDRRFVFIIQRGGADGLGTVAPVGDPAFASQRGALAQDFVDAPKLDSLFALHPSLKNIGQLYKSKEALFVHAVASSCRNRSHFDAQDVLETGSAAAYQHKDGWLNRLLATLPNAERKAIVIADTIPMAMRGKIEVSPYAPSAPPYFSNDLMTHASMLHAGDPQLHAIWQQATATRCLASDLSAGNGLHAAETGALAARLLAVEDGARIAMIETGGWDTHVQQRGRLGTLLSGLDQMVASLKVGLGPLWSNTMILVATEFGRTVKINSTGGTDHGTGSVLMLLGGAVKGGRVVADWPGLSAAALYEARDLKPTVHMDSVIGSVTAAHFGVDPQRMMGRCFRRSAAQSGSMDWSGIITLSDPR